MSLWRGHQISREWGFIWLVCKSPCGCCESKPDALEKQPAPLTTEPSPQPSTVLSHSHLALYKTLHPDHQNIRMHVYMYLYMCVLGRLWVWVLSHQQLIIQYIPTCFLTWFFDIIYLQRVSAPTGKIFPVSCPLTSPVTCKSQTITFTLTDTSQTRVSIIR